MLNLCNADEDFLVGLFKKGDYLLVNNFFCIVKHLNFDNIHKGILYCIRLDTEEDVIVNVKAVENIDFCYDEDFKISNLYKNRSLQKKYVALIK